MLAKRAMLAALLSLTFSAACYAQASVASGSVTISYTVSRLFSIASNQYAIWIEDQHGAFMRTLFVTNYVAKRAGWKVRPQAVPTWVKAADIRNQPQKDVDAVSGATPPSGSHEAVWDLRDAAGNPVPSGDYRYVIEANIFWEDRVLWTGMISLDGQASSSLAKPTYSSAKAEKAGGMITAASAKYSPAR